MVPRGRPGRARRQPEGAVEDSLASVRPWGFDVATIASPLLLVHGAADRMVPASHSRWLADRSGSAELWLRPDDGHVTAMDAGEDVLDWLLAHAATGGTGADG